MIIKETPGSPYVHFSLEDCTFEIKGNSFSQEIDNVYKKIHEWVDENIPESICPLNFIFNFNVLNSVTYKNILVLMRKLSDFQKQGKNITIIWYYDKEDEDSLAIGEDIEELFNIPVVLKNSKQSKS